MEPFSTLLQARWVAALLAHTRDADAIIDQRRKAALCMTKPRGKGKEKGEEELCSIVHRSSRLIAPLLWISLQH